MAYQNFIEEATRDKIKLNKDIEKLIADYEKKYIGMKINDIQLSRQAYDEPFVITSIKLPEYI